MYAGLEFIEGSNALICASAVYSIRTSMKSSDRKTFQFRTGPHGTWVDEVDNYDHHVLSTHAIDDNMSAFLPPKEFGEWDMRKFILALSFWADGNNFGYNKGYSERSKRG